MTVNPLVSVVMPVYNGQNFLTAAVESILNQSFSDFEFVIVDDGSTDRTYEILSAFERKDKRIHLIRQNNQGIVSALNQGIECSQAEIIARIDADDISFPSRLASQVNFLEHHQDVGVLGCFSKMIDKTGKNVSGNALTPVTHNEILWALCFSNPILHPGVMYRKAIIEEISGYQTGNLHAEDYDLWVRLMDHTRFYCIPQKLVLIRKHSDNITTINRDESLRNSEYISQRMISQILSRDVSLETIRHFWEHLDENLPCISLLYEIEKTFINKYLLNEKEVEFIQKDFINRMAFLAHFRKFNIESAQILVEMLKFNTSYTITHFLNKPLSRYREKSR